MSKDSLIKKTVFTKKWQKLPSQIQNGVNTKKLAWDMAHIVLDNVNQYVPKFTGNLQRKGYHIQISNSEVNPWFKLSYRNTSNLKYVMYQYYGKVWGPNYATFELLGPEEFDPHDLRLRESNPRYRHTGWVSSKKTRHETNRYFRRRKKTIWLNKGKSIVITGYTGNKKAQPRWVEYAADRANTASGYNDQLRMKAELVYLNAIKRLK